MGLFDCRHGRSPVGCLLCAQEDTTAAVQQQTAAVRAQTAAFEARVAEERRIAARQAEHENVTRRWAESEAATLEDRAEQARLMGVKEIRFGSPMERLDGTMVGEPPTLAWQMQQLAAAQATAIAAEPREPRLLRHPNTGPAQRPAADDRAGAWQLLSFPALLLALWGTYWTLFTVPGLVALAAVVIYHVTVGRLRVRRGLHRGTAGATAIAALGLAPFAWPGLEGQTDTAVKLYVAAALLALISFIPARRRTG